jgi:hypothetical protein
MGADGELKDASGKPMMKNYRYPTNDSVDLEKSIQEKRKELQELEERKIQKTIKPNVLLKKRNKETESEALASVNSPVFSLVQWF